MTSYFKGAPEEGSLYVDSFLEVKDKYSYFLGGRQPLCVVEKEGSDGPNEKMECSTARLYAWGEPLFSFHARRNGRSEKKRSKRNSFYYNFQDLPALLEEIIAQQVQELIQAHPTIDSVEDCFDAALEFVLENRRAVLHIYRGGTLPSSIQPLPSRRRTAPSQPRFSW